MTVVTAPAEQLSGTSLRSLIPRVRLPELLACAGVATAAVWPGNPLASAPLALAATCMVPLGVRTLLRLEESIVIQGPAEARARAATVTEDFRRCVDQARCGLALLDLAPPGQPGARALVVQANRTLATLPAFSAVGDGVAGHDLLDLLRPGLDASADDLAAAIRALADGTATEHDVVIRPATTPDDALRLSLTRLDATDNAVRVALTVTRLG